MPINQYVFIICLIKTGFLKRKLAVQIDSFQSHSFGSDFNT